MNKQQRPSDFDVTGTVQVSSADSVCTVIRDMYGQLYPGHSFEPLTTVFNDFRRLFQGELPGYRGCDTVYHDMQHTLDMTLAMMRLIGGHEKAHSAATQLGPENAMLGLVTALFHDSGYILHTDDDESVNGAEFTTTHVSRSARFMTEYLPTVGLQRMVNSAVTIVHFTGYEKTDDQIVVTDPAHRLVGQLVGTADLMAQMADRCYLEKCRDRLFSEFVLGGMAVAQSDSGENLITYESGLDLLRKTPGFFKIAQERLDTMLGGVYKYFSNWFEGDDPYTASVQQNQTYLKKVLEDGDWTVLRRQPPVFTTGGQEHLDNTQEMVQLRLKDYES